MPRVVFVCTANSARSQLAAALWAQASAVPATSAGTHPAAKIAPGAARAARKHGLALVQDEPQQLAEVLATADFVVAVCDNAYEELDPGIVQAPLVGPGPGPRRDRRRVRRHLRRPVHPGRPPRPPPHRHRSRSA